MLESSNSKLREKIAAKFGACPIQYKLLLQTEKTVEERALEGKQGTAKLSLFCNLRFLLFNKHLFSAAGVLWHRRVHLRTYRCHHVYVHRRDVDAAVL